MKFQEMKSASQEIDPRLDPVEGEKKKRTLDSRKLGNQLKQAFHRKNTVRRKSQLDKSESSGFWLFKFEY